MLNFFQSNQTRIAIRELSEARQVTVLVGAGASMEVGLPSWEGLVRSLLDDTINLQGWQSDKGFLLERATESGLLSGAEMVAALLNQADLEKQIRKHLYGRDDPRDLYPGPLARSIARMQTAFGRRMRIVTTNYDELIEVALRHRGWAESEIHSYVKHHLPAAGHVGVTHLHGVLGSSRKGNLILSERDYHKLQSRISWQERWMMTALNGSSCLFVGASLADPNLLRYLHGHTRNLRHFALFRRPPAATTTQRRERGRWERMQEARWNEVGVTPLFADNLADITQFVHEVTARRLLRDRYRTLPTRLQRWFDREFRGGHLQRRPAVFLRNQRTMNLVLDEALDRVIRGFEILDRAPRNEVLAIALWTLYLPRGENVRQERVAIWASSDRVMTTSASIQPIDISYESDWTGVKAICDGAPREEQKNIYASRWKYVYAVPVFRQTPSYRLPLGAITLTTTAPADRTVLRRLPAGIRPSLNRYLSRTARELLRHT